VVVVEPSAFVRVVVVVPSGFVVLVYVVPSAFLPVVVPEPSGFVWVVVMEPSGLVRVVVSTFSAGFGGAGWLAEAAPLKERNKKAAAHRLIMIENLGFRFILCLSYGLGVGLS